MAVIRVPVAGTVGKAVRLESDATVGSQLGVNLFDENGNVLTTASLAALLATPVNNIIIEDAGTVNPVVYESSIIDANILARVASDEVITGDWNFNSSLDVITGAALRVFGSGDSANLVMSHDNVDFNFALVGSTDINFTGATGSYKFDTNVLITEAAGPAYLHIQGYQKAYLLLEADTSNINETWNPYIGFDQDGGAVTAAMGLADVGKDGSNATFTGAVANDFTIHNKFGDGGVSIGQENTVSLRIKDDHNVAVLKGYTFQIYDAANTDLVAFVHDGTDFNVTGTNTTDLNIVTGMNLNVADALIIGAGVNISHDGTDLNIALTGTDINFSGATEYKFDGDLSLLSTGAVNIDDTEVVGFVAAAGDADWGSVALLCNFDGGDGASSYTSEDTGLRTATFFGNAQLDTAQFKYGSASLLLDGNGDYITFPHDAAWTLGATFTLEFDVRFDGDPSATNINFMGQYLNTGQQSCAFSFASTVMRFSYSTTGSNTVSLDQTWNPATATWYHLAFVRTAGAIEFFVDGVSLGTNVITATIFDSDQPWLIGAIDHSGPQQFFKGWMDNVRLTPGVARYTTAFTPPTEAFATSTGTLASAVFGDPTLGTTIDGSAVEINADTTLTGDLTQEGVYELTHTAVEDDDHAIEIILDAAGYSDVEALDIDYITGAINTGDDEAVMLINIDESAALGGDVAALEVLATEGSADKVTGLFVGIGIGPIEQLSGTFADADEVLNIAVDVTTAVADGGAGNISIFVDDDDTITIGHAVKFEEIEFLMDTGSSGAGVRPDFEYSTGSGTWGTFGPIDGTNGFRNTGVMAWIDADIPTWAVGTSGDYLIRITRTRNSLTTTPIVDTIQIAPAVSEFGWDSLGDITANSISLASGFALDGALTIWDSGHTDSLAISHDGTDANIVATNTTDINFTGASYYKFDASVWSAQSTIAADISVLQWNETDATTDNGKWRFMAASENLYFQTLNDAQSVAANIFYVTRTGTTVDQLAVFPPVRFYDSGATDYMEMSHDGTDFNFDFTNTGWVWFDGLNSAGGILVRGGAYMRMYDTANTDFVAMGHDGSEFNFTATNTDQFVFGGSTIGFSVAEVTTSKFQVNFTNSAVKIRDGYELRVQDSGDTDYVAMSHDGTDFNIAATNTTDINVDIGSDGALRLGSNTLLRLDDTTDASLSSTGHPLQIGLTGGANLVMDRNEIIARSNGGVSALGLNVEGGNVNVGDADNTANQITLRMPTQFGTNQTKYKAATTNRDTTSTYADDPDLSGWVLQPASFYKVEGCLTWDTGGSNSDLKVIWQLDNAAVGGSMRWDTVDSGGTFITQDVGGEDVEYLCGGGAQNRMTKIVGFIDTHATLDTILDLQWAQQVSDAQDINMFFGSWITITRLGDS